MVRNDALAVTWEMHLAGVLRLRSAAGELPELVVSALREGHQGNNEHPEFQLLHRIHQDGLEKLKRAATLPATPRRRRRFRRTTGPAHSANV